MYNIGAMAASAMRVRELERNDLEGLLEVYRQAVRVSAAEQYTNAQVEAWAQQADCSASALLASLLQGYGLVSCTEQNTVAAFAVLHPADRVALLYCHPRSQGEGRANHLLQALEQRAQTEGQAWLRTEASRLSRPLFERRGWRVSWREQLLINGVLFERFRMHKALRPILA